MCMIKVHHYMMITGFEFNVAFKELPYLLTSSSIQIILVYWFVCNAGLPCTIHVRWMQILLPETLATSYWHRMMGKITLCLHTWIPLANLQHSYFRLIIMKRTIMIRSDHRSSGI